MLVVRLPFTRAPRSGHTKTSMPPDSRNHADGRVHERLKLVGREATQHRHHPVVAAHWVKSQRPRSKPDAGGRKPAAANVADDDAAAGNPVELAHELEPIIPPKVMQHLRADHHV